MRRSMPVDYVDDCHFRKIASDRAANVKPLWVRVRVARWHVNTVRCRPDRGVYAFGQSTIHGARGGACYRFTLLPVAEEN